MTRHDPNTSLAESTAAGAVVSKGFVEYQAGRAVQLPAPNIQGGKPLMECLNARHSARAYSARPILPHVLSDLLWAAFGVNRPQSDGHTAPYWRHVLVIDVYVATAEGVWLYEPKSHSLAPYQSQDLRSLTGNQDFVATAPLDLIYVAHGERMREIVAEERRLYASVDAAFIGQNVYLFCASEGLGTVFRGAVDCEKLGRALSLRAGQFVTFAQTVGYSNDE
jgi:Nitroreductase family